MAFETRIDKTDYGTCSYCGAKKVFNPKTGKVFCEKKCWLNRPSAGQTNIPPRTTSTYSQPIKVEPGNGQMFNEVLARLDKVDQKLEIIASILKGKDETENISF